MDEKIIEAIRMIVESTDCEVTYEVSKVTDNIGGLFRRDTVRRTIINIQITGK